MEIIDYVCELLKITKEEAMNNSKMIEENLTYYWNSNRGGASVIVENAGNYLAAVSSVKLERLLE